MKKDAWLNGIHLTNFRHAGDNAVLPASSEEEAASDAV
jgi:hypothetical protein